MRMNNILILTSVDFRDFFDFNDFWRQKDNFFLHFEDFCIINEDENKSLDTAFRILKEWSNNDKKINEYSLEEAHNAVSVVIGDEKLDLGLVDLGLLFQIKKQYKSSHHNQVGVLVLMFIIDELKGRNWPYILDRLLVHIPGEINNTGPVISKPNGETLASFFDKGVGNERINELKHREEKMSPMVKELSNRTSSSKRVYTFRGKDYSVNPFSSRWALQSNEVYIDILPINKEPIKDLKLQTRLQPINYVGLTVSDTEEVIWIIELSALHQELCITNEGRMVLISSDNATEIAKGSTRIAEEIDNYKRKNNECR